VSITTTVTWADLLNRTTEELDDLRDAYEELKDLAIEEYGDDAVDRTLPNDPDLLDADERDLWVYRTQMEQYNSAKQSIEQRANVLKRIQDEYGEGDFEIRMLTGEETVEIETELRMLAQERDTSIDVVQSKRNTQTVDAATVAAPDEFPTEDGSPVPSKAPNALTLALWEQVNRFNNSGATDFQASGFGDTDPAPSPTAGQSVTPTPSAPSSGDSAE